MGGWGCSVLVCAAATTQATASARAGGGAADNAAAAGAASGRVRSRFHIAAPAPRGLQSKLRAENANTLSRRPLTLRTAEILHASARLWTSCAPFLSRTVIVLRYVNAKPDYSLDTRQYRGIHTWTSTIFKQVSGKDLDNSVNGHSECYCICEFSSRGGYVVRHLVGSTFQKTVPPWTACGRNNLHCVRQRSLHRHTCLFAALAPTRPLGLPFTLTSGKILCKYSAR